MNYPWLFSSWVICIKLNFHFLYDILKHILKVVNEKRFILANWSENIKDGYVD